MAFGQIRFTAINHNRPAKKHWIVIVAEEIDILVATDVAARGIDVKNITLVVNYDLPMESDAYVHRIGRTARAGASGHAVSFCSKEEVALLRQVERLIKKSVPIDTSHDYHDTEAHDLHLSNVPVKKPPQGGGGGQRSGNRLRQKQGQGNRKSNYRRRNPNSTVNSQQSHDAAPARRRRSMRNRSR